MPDIDLDRALTNALHRRAGTVDADPVPLEGIRRRARILRRRRQRRIGTLSVSAVVAVAALIGGGVYATHRTHTTRIDVAGSAPAAPGPRSLPELADTTAGHSCPKIAAAQPTPPTTFLGTNAGRAAAGEDIMLPSVLPGGWCATTPSTFLPADVDSPFTVLASCARCANPTAAVAISVSTDRDTWTAQTNLGEETGTIDGRSYGYKPPTSEGGRAQLAWPKNIDSTSKHTFVLIGHGLNKTQYVQLATQLAAGRQADLPGMTVVYHGRADDFDNTPSGVTRAATLTWVTENGRQIVTYDYQHTAGSLSPAAFAWEYPHAHTVVTDQGVTIVDATDPEAARYAYNYLLVTSDTVIRIQYVSATPRSGPEFPIVMLQNLRAVSTDSRSWTAYATVATRHTTQLSRALAPRIPPTGNFEYTLP